MRAGADTAEVGLVPDWLPEPSVPREPAFIQVDCLHAYLRTVLQYRMSTSALAADLQIEDDSSYSEVGGECVWGRGLEDEERRRLT